MWNKGGIVTKLVMYIVACFGKGFLKVGVVKTVSEQEAEKPYNSLCASFK